MTLAERMVPIYVALIRAELRTIDGVPESIREQVASILESNGE